MSVRSLTVPTPTERSRFLRFVLAIRGDERTCPGPRGSARAEPKRRMSARQVLRQSPKEFQAGDELRLLHEFVRLVRLIDRTRPAHDGRQASALKVAGFGGERDADRAV